MPAFEVVGGGAPTAEQVAAIAAALEVVLRRPPGDAPRLGPWRWSGRWWNDGLAGGLPAVVPNWRWSRFPAHPSRP